MSGLMANRIAKPGPLANMPNIAATANKFQSGKLIVNFANLIAN